MPIWKKVLGCLVVLFGVVTCSEAQDPEVVVLAGLEETISWLEKEQWWGQSKHETQPTVPRAIIVAINENWQKNAPKLEVKTKKEIFYRFMLPLVVHANTMVLDRRDRLKQMAETLDKGKNLSQKDGEWLRGIAVALRIGKKEKIDAIKEPAGLSKVIDQALYRLDVIPAGLVLGQAAYESGYGTSRFAVQGNSLFGQWTFGGDGLVPEQQRKQLGDHRIASYEWPFDSVRGYFINLSSHPAYEDFRRLRAQAKKAGKPLRSMDLADGLKSYSEKGPEYVKTLKGIIRVNNLAVADGAKFRDEPMRFVMGAPDKASAEKLRQEIQKMKTSGEIKKIIERMRLE